MQLLSRGNFQQLQHLLLFFYATPIMRNNWFELHRFKSSVPFANRVNNCHFFKSVSKSIVTQLLRISKSNTSTGIMQMNATCQCILNRPFPNVLLSKQNRKEGQLNCVFPFSLIFIFIILFYFLANVLGYRLACQRDHLKVIKKRFHVGWSKVDVELCFFFVF